MRVTAWMCDRCGRMMPGDDLPEEWLSVQVNTVEDGSKKLETVLFCCRSCAGLWFKPSKNTPRVVGLEKLSDRTVDLTELKCEECDWTPKLGTKNPLHALNLHRRRVHGDLKGATNPTGRTRKVAKK